MRNLYGKVYAFTPLTFILPNDYSKFINEYASQETQAVWICKPKDSSRGRNIFLLTDIGQLNYDSAWVLQRYIPNPLLISGYKWDMRVYVMVTSLCPLKVYLYNEGLVRFGTDKYSLKSLDNKFAHLTNTSINKYAPNWNSKKGVIGPGCKWTFNQLKDYFRSQGMDYETLWFKIKMIVILTLIQFWSSAQNYEWWFELLGFDIFVDKKQKPWLLEVNTPPALGIDCNTDKIIKPQLIKDIVSILDFEKYDDYVKKSEYDTVMKNQKKNYFFKKRFKSQRNQSVNAGWLPNNANTSIKVSPKLVSNSNNYNSMSREANNSLVIQDLNSEKTQSSQAVQSFYSNHSTKNKAHLRKTSQHMINNSVTSGLRPAPYFKSSLKNKKEVSIN